MKDLVAILFFIFSVEIASAQYNSFIAPQSTLDSVKTILANTKNDTLQLVLVNQLRSAYFFSQFAFNADSALLYSEQLLAISQKLDYKIDEAYALDCIGDVMNYLHNQNTLDRFFKGVKIAEDSKAGKNILPKNYLKMMVYWTNDFNDFLVKNNWSPGYFRLRILASLYNDLGKAYGNIMMNQQKQTFYLSKAFNIYSDQKDTTNQAYIYSNIAEFFRSSNQLDSSLLYAQKAYELGKMQISGKASLSYLTTITGIRYLENGNYPLALDFLQQSIKLQDPYQWGTKHLPLLALSKYYAEIGMTDSSLFYAKEAYKEVQQIKFPVDLLNTSTMLAKLYKKMGQNDSALKYFDLSLTINDSINNINKKRSLQSQDFEEQVHQQEVVNAKIAYKNKAKIYALFAGVGSLLIIAFILFRNNLHRKKTNGLLEQKNKEIEDNLNNLRSTQAQLIQSEKMASLGELTAGIAHEIQNPLNFVNNFSEVSNELIEEMKDEFKKGDTEEGFAIADDIKQNLKKILHHGKRADAIVKGMLQHSQSNSGVKELSDINKLTDEYLRLSYHGLRAKDKSFNATLKTHFNESIGNINIIPQDIGRVILNLITNAFYAVDEKRKSGIENFEPVVSVSTKKTNDKVEIKVSDNGNGIPQKIVDKIFQPFFTTKPTGQGTGLGLSLSYDIVKAHGGEIKVESKEGEGSEFIIQLPII